MDILYLPKNVLGKKVAKGYQRGNRRTFFFFINVKIKKLPEEKQRKEGMTLEEEDKIKINKNNIEDDNEDKQIIDLNSTNEINKDDENEDLNNNLINNNKKIKKKGKSAVTFRALFIGGLIGSIICSSNIYIGLKVCFLNLI